MNGNLAGLLLMASLALPAGATEAELPTIDAALLAKMRSGGYVIYVRHSHTDRKAQGAGGGGHADCSTQRNLTEAGRHQAATIGKAIRALRIPVGPVYASIMCRSRETADLAFGSHEVLPGLKFSFDVPAEEREQLRGVLRRILGTPPPQGSNVVVVAHSANLREAAGIWPKPEGTTYVFEPLPGGDFRAVARMTPADWVSSARTD